MPDDATPQPQAVTRLADPESTAARPRTAVTVACVAVVAGIALGGLDLLAQRTLPYPWANLANSSAVWAVAAFAIGAWAGRGAVRCVVAAVVLLLVAVEAYTVFAVWFLHDDPFTLTSPATVLWLVFGVVAGCVFGFGGHLRAVRGPWPAAVGAALPAAVLLAEAAVLAGRGGKDGVATGVIEIVLVVVVAVLAGRGPRGKLLAVAFAVPLGALGWAAFSVVGLGAR